MCPLMAFHALFVHRVVSWIDQTVASLSYIDKDKEPPRGALGETARSGGGIRRSEVSHLLCQACALQLWVSRGSFHSVSRIGDHFRGVFLFLVGCRYHWHGVVLGTAESF